MNEDSSSSARTVAAVVVGIAIGAVVSEVVLR